MAEMLTAKQIQQLLHVDRSTVYRMAEDGRLPAIKVGRQWRFPANEISDWLEQQGTVPDANTFNLPQPVRPLVEGLPVECVQVVQDTFADVLGVMMLVTDMEGHPVTQVSNPCGLYTATLPQSQALCREQWYALANTVELKPRFVACQLGLLCIRGVIREGNRLRGTVAIGGIAPALWPPSEMQIDQIAADLSVGRPLIAANINRVHYLNPEQLHKVQTTVQRIADIISHILNERNRLTA